MTTKNEKRTGILSRNCFKTNCTVDCHNLIKSTYSMHINFQVPIKYKTKASVSALWRLFLAINIKCACHMTRLCIFGLYIAAIF